MILFFDSYRFVLVVDSMYRNRVRKIVVFTQIVRRLLLFDKERPTLDLSKLSKTFAVYLIKKNNMMQINQQVVSDIENKDTHCNCFCTGCNILITLRLQS